MQHDRYARERPRTHVLGRAVDLAVRVRAQSGLKRSEPLDIMKFSRECIAKMGFWMENAC